MSRVLYQTHSPAERGMVDSLHRLERLMMPAALDGSVVLDIGCNEGFFCGLAAERGAKRVIGIDGNEQALNFAKGRYPSSRVEFRLQKWSSLPDEVFDLVIWTSAMHYEQDPLSVLREVHRRLAPDGLLILECGAVSSQVKEMVPVQRHDGTHIYPSLQLVEDYFLEDFAWRQVAAPETVGSDPVPRYVFHCTPRKAMIMVFRGKSGAGKSVASAMFSSTATKKISLDLFVFRIAAAQFQHSEFEQFVRRNHNGSNLTELYESIDANGLTSSYIALLTRTIASSDRLVIIDGYMTDIQLDELSRLTGSYARIWDAGRCV
jgi:SAM-dependent methyltransferase